MADSKYGRLFTEADAKAMALEAACAGLDWPADETAGAIAERVVRDYVGRFPPDEPLFLLRGQDKAAPDAISTGSHPETFDYERSASAVGAEIEHLDAIAKAADRMRAWQAANPDRVKVPD